MAPLVAALVALPIFAIAQQATTPPAAAEAAAPSGEEEAIPSNLSPKEQLAAANNAIARMKTAAAGIARQLDQARRERDTVRVLCLDDKLSQANVAVRSADEHKGSLAAAAGNDDAAAAGQESAVIGVLSKRSAQIVIEANQCVGDEELISNTDESVVRIDPNIAESENGGFPDEVAGDINFPVDPPQCTSCAR